MQPPDPPRSLEAENQFGKFRLQIGQALALLVPTQKIERGSAFAEDLDHYKVYVVLESEAAPAIGLSPAAAMRFVPSAVRAYRLAKSKTPI